MPKELKRLGDLLIEARLISREQLNAAIADQKKSGSLLGTALVQLGFISEEALVSHLQRQLGLPLIDLSTVVPDEAALLKIKKVWAKKCVALPIRIDGRYLVVAMADPLDVSALESLRFQSGMLIQPALASAGAILEAIERHCPEIEHCPACGDHAGECEKCHRPLASRWRYCAFCGAQTPAVRSQPPGRANGPSSDRDRNRDRLRRAS